MDWTKLNEVTGTLVDIAVLLGAIVAVVKFRLFNVLGHRWRSDLDCNHWDLVDGSVVFRAEYTIHNTGQRTLRMQDVTMKLVAAKREGALLVPDRDCVLAEREMHSGDPNLKGIFQIEAGERTIFTLRCLLPQLDDVVFVLCTFNLKYKRVPAGFLGFYCRGSKDSDDQAPQSLLREPSSRTPRRRAISN